jgi:hypothetical protein
MSTFDLNSYFITDAQTNYVLDAQGKIFIGAGDAPVKLGSAVVSGIVALIGVAVNVTSTAMTINQQKKLLEEQRRLAQIQSNVVNSIRAIYSGYNVFTFEVSQNIKNMNAAILERQKKLSGFTFVSEEKRLGGLIQNGYAELANNGFSNGILDSAWATIQLAKQTTDKSEQRNRIAQLIKQLDVYGVVLCVVRARKNALALVPKNWVRKQEYSFNSAMYPWGSAELEKETRELLTDFDFLPGMALKTS